MNEATSTINSINIDTSNISKKNLNKDSNLIYTEEDIKKLRQIISFRKWYTILIRQLIYSLMIILFFSFLLLLKCYNINKYPLIIMYIFLYGISITNFILLLKTIIEYKFVIKTNILEKTRVISIDENNKVSFNVNSFERSINDYVMFRNITIFIEIALYIMFIIFEISPSLPEYANIGVIVIEYYIYLKMRMYLNVTIKIINAEIEYNTMKRKKIRIVSPIEK